MKTPLGPKINNSQMERHANACMQEWTLHILDFMKPFDQLQDMPAYLLLHTTSAVCISFPCSACPFEPDGDFYNL